MRGNKNIFSVIWPILVIVVLLLNNGFQKKKHIMFSKYQRSYLDETPWSAPPGGSGDLFHVEIDTVRFFFGFYKLVVTKDGPAVFSSNIAHV